MAETRIVEHELMNIEYTTPAWKCDGCGVVKAWLVTALQCNQDQWVSSGAISPSGWLKVDTDEKCDKWLFCPVCHPKVEKLLNALREED